MYVDVHLLHILTAKSSCNLGKSHCLPEVSMMSVLVELESYRKMEAKNNSWKAWP